MRFVFVYITAFLTFLLNSCNNSITPEKKVVQQLKKDHSIRQYEKYGYQCNMTGGGSNGERITHLSIGFITPEQLDIKSARLQLIESVFNFVNLVNKNKTLDIYFTNWPFDTTNVKYSIKVDRGDGLSPRFPGGINQDNHISYVSFDDNEICYFINIEPKKLPETVLSETLDEAIAILIAEGWTEPKN